jgi:hypothetical protein
MQLQRLQLSTMIMMTHLCQEVWTVVVESDREREVAWFVSLRAAG